MENNEEIDKSKRLLRLLFNLILIAMEAFSAAGCLVIIFVLVSDYEETWADWLVGPLAFIAMLLAFDANDEMKNISG